MKNLAVFVLILLVILLVSCQDAAPEATAVPEPTSAAEDTPIQEVSPEVPEATEAPEPTAAPTEVPAEETAPEPTPEAAEDGDTTTDIADEQLAQMAAIAPPPQLSEREPGIQTIPCLPGISSGENEVEGEDYYCGIFTVPQNWDEPDGPYLDLAFAVVKTTGENPQPDPLLYLIGGPGSTAVWNMNPAKYQKLRGDRDIIYFDYRGVGLSQRLGFEECLVLALQNDAPAEQIATLRTAVPNLLAKASGQEAVGAPDLAELDLAVINQICWEQFTAQGIDPNHFSTADSARDAVELIKALGYTSFNIDSVSFGTRLAMTIMNDIPGYDAAPELRSVVLDSAFPPSVYLIRTLVRSNHDFLPQLLDECGSDAVCNEAYPNLSERLSALLIQLEEAPITASEETVMLEDVAARLKDTGSGYAAYLPKMIAELETGVLDTYLALRDGEVDALLPEPLPAAEAVELDPNDPVQAFVAAVLDLLSPEDALVFPTYFQFLVIEEDPVAVLPEFIAETYPGETADQMLALAETLTPEDFANSPYVARLQAEFAAANDPEARLASERKGNAQQMAQLLYSSIHCIDDILHESFEDAVESYNSLAFPQLTNLDQSQVFAARCENWLVDPAPIEVKDPVTSDVPALILQGDYDKSTPVYMGRQAEKELANSTYVLIPQQGHGTWSYAESCVGQIATAFVQDPDAELDLSCLEARQPQWALPGDGAP